MKAVVTGATGAVGMALLLELIENNTETLVLCRASSKRSANIPDHPLIRKIDCPLNKMSELDTKGEKFDVFFHLAWAGTTGAARNDMYVQTDNIKYTADAVCLAERFGCHAFVGVGSQAEYGRVEGKINSKTPAFPENGYGMAKLCAGEMSRIMCKERGIKHVWARILSVYGPYDGENTLVGTAIKKFSSGERASFTRGEQMWDYLYSRDAAKALIAIGDKGRDGGVYCLGSGKTAPLREYIEVIRKKIDCGAEAGYGDVPYAEGQVMYLCADISELVEDTGFVPTESFESGITKTLEWYFNERKM